MRYLWVCNIELPVISDLNGNKRVPIGGWLDTFSRKIIANNNNNLMVVYPHIKSYIGQDNNLFYSSFDQKTDLSKYFLNILNTFKPDIIHLWGTEFKFTYFFTEVIKSANLVDKTLISIQGLISTCSRHYFGFLPINVIKPYSFKDLIKNRSLIDEKKAFEKRGKFEIKALNNIKHVIGRTDWDKALTSQINTFLIYHHCNEVMRDIFYKNSWDYKNVTKDTIFITQNNYPIKGFHILLEAVGLIRNKFPNLKIKTTGQNFLHKPFYKLSSYEKYLKELIINNNLESSIIFMGEINEEQMVKALQDANVFVLPSIIENSSNSLAEAMLLGMPIVASFVGGIQNFINDGVEGLLYPADEPYMLAHQLTKILLKTEDFIKIGQNAMKKAFEIFDSDKNFDNLISIYKSLK
jgi:glycosyltransferase involved in cell wall biosynthesis